MEEQVFDLTPEQIAQIAGCHRSTVLRYEQRGFIASMRDHNNYRRYSRRDAKKLREILNIRRPAYAS